MGSKHSRPSSDQPAGSKARPDALRSRDKQQEDEILSKARAEFTVEDIRSPENTRRAQTLRAKDNDRFCKYRNYFKNHHMSLAREVSRRTSKSRAELLSWVEEVVGPLEEADKYTKDEILEIAMVSAAITEYGEHALTKLYDRGELDALPNVPLHTHNLRMPAQQQKCRDNSDAANKDQLEAAHYIGLEVMLRLNERLPVEQRMGEELREILNHPSNLRLMLATSNQVLHKKVDAMLITAGEVSIQSTSSNAKNTRQRKISAREYDRLVQIAKHAQDDGFQDAMIAANGHYLYASLREQFNRLDIGDRPKLWDIQKDKRELQKAPQRRSRSPVPTQRRQTASVSPTRKSKAKPRIVHETASPTGLAAETPPASETEHRSTFSRLAAKIFRSHSKKKKKNAAAARSAPTAALDSSETSRPVKSKAGGREKKSKLPAKKNAKRTSSKPSSNARGQAKPKKTTAKKKTRPSQPEAAPASLEDDYSEDSDYVDSDSSADIASDDRVLHVGPRGGKYYINAAGKKTYVK